MCIIKRETHNYAKAKTNSPNALGSLLVVARQHNEDDYSGKNESKINGKISRERNEDATALAHSIGLV